MPKDIRNNCYKMSDNGSYRKIFDFIFSGNEVSESLKEEFFLWMEAHGDEPQTKALLEEYWESVSAESPDFDMQEGLKRLMEAVNGTEKKSPVKHGRRFRIAARIIGGAAATVALFFGGWTTARLSGVVETTETVLVASDESIASYTLPDGTNVWLNRGSRLSYTDAFGARKRAVSLDGECFFEVTKDASRPFIVGMNNNLSVRVLGTSFNASTYPGSDKAEIILRSGSVQVSDSMSEEKVILKPDQRYSWDRGTTEISHVDAAQCCRWFEKRLVFDNARLQDILDNLSHKYQTPFYLKARNLAGKRMSLTVRDESLEEILDVLSFLLPIKWEMRDNQIIITNKPQTH